MLVQSPLIDAAVQIISSSLASNSITDWTIQTSKDNTFTQFPSVNVICNQSSPLYKELNIGDERAILTIATAAIKTQTSRSEFDSVSKTCIEPFFNNNILETINGVSSDIFVKAFWGDVSDDNTMDDGWIIKQDFEVVLARTS